MNSSEALGSFPSLLTSLLVGRFQVSFCFLAGSWPGVTQLLEAACHSLPHGPLHRQFTVSKSRVGFCAESPEARDGSFSQFPKLFKASFTLCLIHLGKRGANGVPEVKLAFHYNSLKPVLIC